MEQFTWGQFGLFILALLVLYYMFILFYYYSGELNSLIGGRRNPATKKDNIVSAPVTGSPLAAPVQPVSYKEDEKPEESEEEVGEIVPDPDQQVLIESQDYDFEEAFTKDYHEADPDQLPELEELVADGDVEPDADELGVEAEEYINATSLISKPEIPAEQLEPVKSTIGKVLFNESVLKQYQLSANAHANIDTIIGHIEAEGRMLPETRTAFFSYHSVGDEDMQKLLDTLN